MAALEFSVLGRQGVDRRLPDHDTLVRAIAAGEAPRHSTQAPMLWRFSTADARIKLTPRYPIVQVHEDQHDVAPPDQPTSTAA